MATVYSAQRTNALAIPSVNNKANELGGRIRVAHGTYEAASLAADSVIEMFILPDGARLLEGSLGARRHWALRPLCRLATLHTPTLRAPQFRLLLLPTRPLLLRPRLRKWTFLPLSRWVRAPRLTPTKMACP
jgi:hypothetical protein